MKLSIPLLLLTALLLTSADTPRLIGAAAAPVSSFVPARGISGIPPAQAKLAYSVVIENRVGGFIRVVEPPAMFLLNRPGVDIGTVLRPATKVDTQGYHASSWGEVQSVVASSVNAVHLKVYDNAATGRAGVITLLPRELNGRDLAGNAAKLMDDMIYTDIPGGHGIFGGSHPLIVGNPASFFSAEDLKRQSFNPAKVSLSEGDILIVEVRTPSEWPRELIIENRRGGSLTLHGADGQAVACGTVAKSFTGSGRFAGGVFCECGGIRATHTAVIDLSFSPEGQTGGVQFIPEAHSHSSELTYSQQAAPYGILLGPDGLDLRAQAPLFSGYLYPVSQLQAPAVLPRLTVCAQLDNADGWVPLPEARGQKRLSSVKALRFAWEL